MNRNNVYYFYIIGIFAFILLHKSMIIFLGNISALMKEDNKCIVDEKMYKTKIENLEKQLFEYESSMKNLSIYDQSTYIFAKVSIRDIYDFFDYIIINADSIINKGSAVLNEDGLVGIISSSDGNIAKVNLLTGSSKISVKVASSYGLLNGYDKKKKMLIVRNINNYEPINIGDIVETSGLSDIDGALKIGVVEDIENKGVEKIVYVKPYVNFDELNYLYVVNK